MTRGAMLVALCATAGLAHAQPMQHGHPPGATADRPPDFSCPNSQPLDFTREELEQKAAEEVARRGGRMPPRHHFTLKRWGCDWWVFVLQEPSVPGGDYGVLVDGISGAPKQYVRR